MHEVGIAEGILAAVERRAAGRPVRRVRVRIGAQHRVVADALAQAFELVAAGGVAEGADVELVDVPSTLSCRACGRRTEVADPHAVCPACGATDVELSGGDEMTLESIEVAPTGEAVG